MLDIKARVPEGTLLVGNFVFGRKRIAAGAVPDINTVPVGTALLLALEPARDNEDEPLAPGVRIGTDFWEMTEAIQGLNDAGYHPLLFLHRSALENIGLLQGEQEAQRFRYLVGKTGALIPDVPHNLVVDDIQTLRYLRQIWCARGEPVGDVYLNSPADPLLRAAIAPSKRARAWNPDARQNPLFNINALLLNMPMRDGGAQSPKRDTDIMDIATALTRTDELFGPKKKAVLLHISEFGVDVPPMAAPVPPRDETPEALTS